jgi:SIR2-like domain
MFSDTLPTTNYNGLLEQVYDTGGRGVQVIHGVSAMDLPEPDKVTIIKIHGDFQQSRGAEHGQIRFRKNNLGHTRWPHR